MRHLPPFVVRWCWPDRAMEVAVLTLDGEATATPMAQGQVHAAKTLKSTPAASATGYSPRLIRSRDIQRASEPRRGHLTYPARHIRSWILNRRPTSRRRSRTYHVQFRNGITIRIRVAVPIVIFTRRLSILFETGRAT